MQNPGLISSPRDSFGEKAAVKLDLKVYSCLFVEDQFCSLMGWTSRLDDSTLP